VQRELANGFLPLPGGHRLGVCGKAVRDENGTTLKDKAFTENHLSGVGVKSGEVATAVAGEKYIVSGYAGIGVLNPYRSYVLIQN
jgi:stage III sporulation protein SpoIIIAA